MKNRTFGIAIISILLVFIILFAYGCNKRSGGGSLSEEASNTLKRPFDAVATIKMKDLVLVADINKTDIGCATIQVKEPKSLKDMNFQYDGKDIKVGYKGLSITLNEESKLVSSVVSLIVDSIDKAADQSGMDVGLDGKVLTVAGSNENGAFSIKLDRDNGSIASVNLPELDFVCNFSDFLPK